MEPDHKKYGTDFIESEALLAITQDDWNHARSLVQGLLPNERLELANAAETLAHMCYGRL